MQEILYISPFQISPPSTGGERAILSYIEQNSKNHIINLCVPYGQEPIPIHNIRLHHMYPNSKEKYVNIIFYLKLLKLALRIKPTLIVVALPYQAYFAYAISRFTGAKFAINEQNVEFLRFKRLGKWWWPLMFLFEFVIYRLTDYVYYISENDKSIISDSFYIPKIKFLSAPYIADKKIFKVNNESRAKVRRLLRMERYFIVLFFGPLDYKPNFDALSIIANKIAPGIYVKNKFIKFLIVGKNPPNNINKPNLVFTGYVDKIEDYINASDLVIVPLTSGGGVRTKIIESISCGKKVLSTNVGSEGLDLTYFGKSVMIENSWDRFSKKILSCARQYLLS
jgi:polysaccharide biosynthesis protein PslH